MHLGEFLFPSFCQDFGYEFYNLAEKLILKFGDKAELDKNISKYGTILELVLDANPSPVASEKSKSCIDCGVTCVYIESSVILTYPVVFEGFLLTVSFRFFSEPIENDKLVYGVEVLVLSGEHENYSFIGDPTVVCKRVSDGVEIDSFEKAEFVVKCLVDAVVAE